MVVQRSTDTEHWELSITLDVCGDDRDAQLLPTKERLFLYVNSLKDGVFQVSVALPRMASAGAKQRCSLAAMES